MAQRDNELSGPESNTLPTDVFCSISAHQHKYSNGRQIIHQICALRYVVKLDALLH